MPARSRILLAVGFLLVTAGVWLAWSVYVGRTRPEAGGPGFPPASVLTEAAEARIRRAVSALQDTDLEAGARMTRYREELAAAERLLERSLAANPAQAAALADLAAVRWELKPSFGNEALAEHRRLIELSATMAPRSPRVHRKLGELLLNMGLEQDGIDYLARAVELSAESASEVVRILDGYGLPPGRIFVALPRTAEVLTALRWPYVRDGMAEAYLQAAETLPGVPDAALLKAYCSVGLGLGQTDRVLHRLLAMEPLAEPVAESERRVQLARSSIALSDSAAALEWARQAVAVRPGAPYPLENLGDVALLAGEAVAGVEAYGRAVGAAARIEAGDRWRARLYAKLGRARERAGDHDGAVDAYRNALRLDAEQPIARPKLESWGLMPR